MHNGTPASGATRTHLVLISAFRRRHLDSVAYQLGPPAAASKIPGRVIPCNRRPLLPLLVPTRDMNIETASIWLTSSQGLLGRSPWRWVPGATGEPTLSTSFKSVCALTSTATISVAGALIPADQNGPRERGTSRQAPTRAVCTTSRMRTRPPLARPLQLSEHPGHP